MFVTNVYEYDLQRTGGWGRGGGGSKSSWIQKQCDENNNLFRLPIFANSSSQMEKLFGVIIKP